MTGRTVSCSSRTRGRCDSSRGEFGLVFRQHGDSDRLQSLPALPPRRATSCRALVDHVPDHPAQGEEQPAQPRKAPALAAAPRTPGGERAHRQPDRRRRQAKRPNALSAHPSTLPSPGGRRCPGGLFVPRQRPWLRDLASSCPEQRRQYIRVSRRISVILAVVTTKARGELISASRCQHQGAYPGGAQGGPTCGLPGALVFSARASLRRCGFADRLLACG